MLRRHLGTPACGKSEALKHQATPIVTSPARLAKAVGFIDSGTSGGQRHEHAFFETP